MDYRRYMRRIEDAIGKIHAADRIDEGPWLTSVMSELNAVSRDLAVELQSELESQSGTPMKYIKPGYTLGLHEAPPTRLFALELALAAWCGWVMHEKHPDPSQLFSAEDCLSRIRNAWTFGVNLSMERQKP